MITRRVLLRNGALAVLGLGAVPPFLQRLALASAPGRRQKTLVIIFQRGGVDGLNTIIPFGEKEYYRSRPSIAIPRPSSQEGTALDLDGFFGMHPSLQALLPAYQKEQLAVVQAVGSPHESRSHFEAQDFVESASSDYRNSEGWVNRYLTHNPDPQSTSFRAVSIGSSMPYALQGPATALNVNEVSSFGLKAGRANGPIGNAFESLYSRETDTLLAGTGRELFDAIDFLKKNDLSRYQSDTQYPRGQFARALKQVAQLIKAQVGLEVAFVDFGGWDHHFNEGGVNGQLANLLRQFSEGLTAFTRDLGDRLEDVVTVKISEFGRTVAENGNAGTDHGYGNLMMILGGPGQRRSGLRAVARAQAGAAFSGSRSGLHHRFSEPPGRSAHRSSGRPGRRSRLPGFFRRPEAIPRRHLGRHNICDRLESSWCFEKYPTSTRRIIAHGPEQKRRSFESNPFQAPNRVGHNAEMAEEDRVFANEARYPERKQAGAFRQVISRTFQAFRYRDFRLMWFGAFTSTTGTWMQQVAEAWVVLELTGSAFYLGLTRFLGELPILLFTLVAGVTADRVDRRWQLLASQYTQMTCAFILATLVVLDRIQIWHFLLLAFVVGTGQSFGGPAYQALVPGLVQKKDLANAIALNSIQFNLARVVGPLLAGAALATLGAALCFLFNGISFVAVIISLYLIRATFRPPKTGESVLTGLRQGLAFVKNQGALWQLSVLGFASTFCGIPLLVLLPIFARDRVCHRRHGLLDHAGLLGSGLDFRCPGLRRPHATEESRAIYSARAAGFRPVDPSFLGLREFDTELHHPVFSPGRV